jgi:protein-disulfide isomerase
MNRRLLVALLRRSILVLLLICLGCSAQSLSPDVSRRIERQVRSNYSVPPTMKLILSPLKPSEWPNYDALTITFDNGTKKQNLEFLLSRDGNTLLHLTKMDISKDPYAEVMKKIDLTGRPTRGNKDAKVVVVNYDDFQCPFCSQMHQTLFPQLLKEYADRVMIVYKDYPLAEIHPWAIHAAVNANCLGAQSVDAYWNFADYMHAHQKDVNTEKGREAQFAALDRLTLEQGQKQNLDAAKLQACVTAQNADAVNASVKEGDQVGVEATPTLFINGQKADGARSVDEVRALLDLALEQAGVQPAHPGAVPAKAPSLQ